jgi:hypothetical protein
VVPVKEYSWVRTMVWLMLRKGEVLRDLVPDLFRS